MANKQLTLVLNQVLERVEPPKEDIDFITEYLKDFINGVKKEIKKQRIVVEVFVGGSFAKKTMIKKDKYDVDVFLRFDKKYGNKISELAKKLIKEKYEVIHGSRDYFRIKVNPHFSIELIPVIKVSKPELSENITDLSYSHVRYINKKMKNKKLLDEIKIAKAFCYANNCYGAESYIGGFSGYALELLVYHYGSFIKFLKGILKGGEGENKHKGIWTKEYEKKYDDLNKKIVIDIEKNYKNKAEILIDLNSAKLQSPIVLIDPTFQQRNVSAALSEETLDKFKKSAKKFLKTPSIKAFETEKIDYEKEKGNAKKNKKEFILIEIETDKQEGDVAGSKLLKFYKHISEEIEKFFNLKNKGFEYNDRKTARVFFSANQKKEILFEGPLVKDEKSVGFFKKWHKNTFEKKGRVFAREKVNVSLGEFIKKWVEKNSKKVKEMYIEKLEIKDVL